MFDISYSLFMHRFSDPIEDKVFTARILHYFQTSITVLFVNYFTAVLFAAGSILSVVYFVKRGINLHVIMHSWFNFRL